MKRRKISRFHQKQHPRMQLRMVPMIDVVFLLLVFFLLAANFRSKEGYLPAELPRQVTRSVPSEIPPLTIYVANTPGGCEIQIETGISVMTIGENEHNSFNDVGQQILSVLAKQGRNLEDPVKLQPFADTKWDYVVKTYDMLWDIDLHNIIFATARN